MEKHLTWAEVDLNAYAHNIAELKKLTGKDTRLMAVVKANGYGHGAIEVARRALQSGAQNSIKKRPMLFFHKSSRCFLTDRPSRSILGKVLQ